MLLLLLTASIAFTPFGSRTTADSVDRMIVVAPAESLHITMVGPESGPTVLIVPGLVSPAYAFRHVLPPLADAGVRAVVIEPLGVGASSRPSNADYSHAAQAHRVAAVMDSLHLTQAVTMAHAVGVPIALRMALARPELVHRLLLVEEGPVESAAVPGVKNALKFAFFIRIFAGRGRVKKELRKGLIASSGDTTWVTDAVIEGYTRGPAGDIGAVLRALKGMQNSPEPDSLTPRLGQLQIPVRLLLGGAPHKSGISASRLRALEEHVHSFSMQTVIGAGLHIHEEQPDVIVRELLALVNERHR
jgi:pimeloyl-ACP methyl ester carboxylesterase